MTERRSEHRREEDDPDKQLKALRDDLDKKHADNANRFDSFDRRLKESVEDRRRISAKLDNLEQVLVAHMADEDQTKTAIQSLHACIDQNAAELKQQITSARNELRVELANLKDNLFPLLLVNAGKKTWRLATVGRKCVQWLTPIIVGVLLIWEIVLYVLGKGQFPRP